MAYKTILVHVDESQRASERIKIASAIAMAENAHLIGTAVTGASRYLIQERALEVDPNLRRHLDDLRARAQHGLADFEACVQKLGLRSFEKRLVDDEAGAGISLQARYADLVVIGQYDPDEVSPVVMHDFPQYVVLNCGRPVLLVPHTGQFDNIGRRVLIGWDASLASIHAASAALPLLQRAQQITAVTFGESEREKEAPPLDELQRYLARHGVNVDMQRREDSRGVGAAMLSLCAELDADLLVMGGYGHSRFREILLGGVTRAVLTEMAVPVLMAH
ncbi:MAG TPA: universal stress protein [Noviherbaspirillum sp.]|nr:universal stress protein [Noviherbaspirillum sp.]